MARKIFGFVMVNVGGVAEAAQYIQHRPVSWFIGGVAATLIGVVIAQAND